MTAQEKVKQWRKDHALTVEQMARQLHISEMLMTIILVPVHLRPHGGDYDPDRYVAPADIAERRSKQ